MLCRITGKVCTAWSETAGCGLVRCKFVEDKGGDEGMTDRRKDCPMRHERWEIVVGSDGKEHMVCTGCRKQQDLTGVFSYCPNCGAIMDLEEAKNAKQP